MYNAYIGRKFGDIQDLLNFVDMYQFLKEYLLLIDVLLFYVGMPVLPYDASAMCLDLNLFLPEADS
jgi:hypothetical protein